MLRKEWEFEYTASNLAQAAEAKRAHHESRLQWWQTRKDEVMKEVRESGIEVSESDAVLYSNSTPMRGPQVMVRNDLQDKLTEAHSKIQDHAAKVREYDGWVQVLDGNSEARVKLNQDDWLYFFGK